MARTMGSRSLAEPLLAEAEAMARYAMAQGTAIQPEMIGELAGLRQRLGPLSVAPPEPSTQGSSRSGGARPAPPAPPAAATRRPLEREVEQLAEIHQQLARVVAPATPRTLLLLAEHDHKSSWSAMLGPVALVRRLIAAALLCLASLLGLSVLPEVGVENISKGFFENSGAAQMYCQSFLLAAAGLGACFAALFEVNRYVGKGVYDRKYDASYWSRLVLGLMAGVMLAELLGPQFIETQAMAPDAGHAVARLSGSSAFAKPTLAMLGGFSASLVHRILERLVQSVESLVSGSDEGARTDAKETVTRMRLQSESQEERMKLAARLSMVQARLGDVPQASAELAAVVQGLADGPRGHLVARHVGPPPEPSEASCGSGHDSDIER